MGLATTVETVSASRRPLDEVYCLGSNHREPQWYVAYTCSHHEKRIEEQLTLRSVEHFLPLYETVSRWKDRKVRLHLPLFPNYIFVRIALRDQLNVLKIPGVVRLVGFNGSPTALPEREIMTLRRGLSSGLCAEPHPYLAGGRLVRITHGPFAGLEGIFVRRKGLNRVIISLALIKSSMAVEVGDRDVRPR